MMEAVEVKTFTANALIFTIVLLGTYFVKKVLTGSIRNGLPLPPSLPTVPVLGSFPFMSSLKDLPEFFRKTSLRLGPVFGLSIGSHYAVVLNTREIIYEALVKKAGAFSGRLAGFTNVHFLNPNEYGIISKQYGQLFRKIHKLSLSILKDFGFGSKILEDKILVEVDELTDIIKEENGAAFNPTRIFSMCTLNVIASMVFGQRLGQKDSTLDGLYKTLVFFMQDKRRHVDVCPALRYLPYYKTVIEKSVANQNAQIDDIEKFSSDSLISDRDCFVKKFVELEGKDSYDKDELKFIIRDLLIAGSETSSTSTQYAMIRMANYPQVMKRMQAEIDSLASREDHVTIDHMTSLPYCEAVIMEISRSQTVLPLALPHFTLEDAELAGYFIPKGCMVYVNIHSAHMDPKTFENPEEFNPERFLDQEGRVKGKDLLIPFSIGKRSCLGELLARQEVFLIITNLVHKFDILPPEGEESVTVSQLYMITSYPTPFQLRFIPRA